MHKLDAFIEHSGVKGMHWGVRHDEPKQPERSKIGKHLDSFKRERQWHKVLREIHNMTTKDIRTATKRISLENSLKNLTKTKMATKKDKQDYLRRHNMTDEELSRKISRLQAKDALHRAVKEASKEQREFGIKVVQVGSSIGVKYAMHRKLTPKDIFDAVQNPTIKTKQDVFDTGVKIAAGRAKNKKVKDALEVAKTVKVKPKSKA